MSFLQFIAALVASLAWPISVALLVWILRESIQQALLKVTSFKYKDIVVDFGHGLKELEDKAKIIDITTAKQSALPAPEKKATYQILDDSERLTQDFPAPAVALAWSAVESEMMSAVSRLAISPDYPADNSAYKNVNILKEHGIVDIETLDVLNRLRNLRNVAVHGGFSGVTSDEAREYVAIARGVVEKLKNLIR